METKFTKVVELFPNHTKQFLPVKFTVPEGTELVGIRFTYSPMEVDDAELATKLLENKLTTYAQECEKVSIIPEAVKEEWRNRVDISRFLPLRNLLNFSIYDPSESFVGRWDSPQYFGKWMTIGRENSRGFLCKPLIPGEWTLELEVHSLLSERVEAVLEFNLQVNTEKQWFAGEMHSHTNNSDGKSPLSEVIEKLKQKSLDFLVLSDHNTTAAYPDIPKEGAPLIIPGLEWTTFYGHSVAVGIKEYIDWRTKGRDDDLREKINEVQRQGGLFSVAHPYTVGDPVCTGCQWEYGKVDPDLIDTVEIWSGSWRKGAIPNWRAIAWWDELLNQGYRITGVAARDMHQLSQFDFADTANTYVRAYNCTQQEILAGLKQGDVQVSVGPLLDVKLVGEGMEYTLGDTVSLSTGIDYVLKVNCDTTLDSCLLRVIVDGEQVHQQPTDGATAWEIPLKTPKRWCRVQIHQNEPRETPVVIGNCIYFSSRREFRD